MNRSMGGQGLWEWSGWATRWLPGLCLLSFLPPQPLLPTSSYIQTFQDWGEPQTPRTPRGGAPHIPRSGTLLPVPWGGGGEGAAVVPVRWALPLRLRDGAAGPPRGPLTTLFPLKVDRRVKFLLWYSFILPNMVPFHTVISLSCSPGPDVGEELEARLGSVSQLSALGTAAGKRGMGCSLHSPFLSFPLSLQDPWLASSSKMGQGSLRPLSRATRPLRPG